MCMLHRLQNIYARDRPVTPLGTGKEMHRSILLENTPFSCKMYQYKWNDLAKVCKIYEKVRCFGNETGAQRLILAVG